MLLTFFRSEFRILHTASRSRFYHVFEARPLSIVNRKVLTFSREMPAVLQLEPRPALKALTEIFGDIVLYFFSFEQTQRSSKDLNIILRFMNREKLKLRSDISGVELFTSNQL